MNRAVRALVLAAVVVAGLAATASDVFASHFRYGTITWSTPNPAQPHLIQVRFDSAWRRSFFSPTPVLMPPTVVNVGSLEVFTAATSPALVTSVPVNATTTSVNPAEDWFTASFTVNITLPPNLDRDYIIVFRSCCRISTLQNNNFDKDFVVTSRVTVRNPVNRPPTAASLPIVTVPINQPVDFIVPAFDPDGDPVRYTITPTGTNFVNGGSGMVTAAPSGSPAMTVHNTTGAVTWTPTAVGLYAVQFTATDLPAGTATTPGLKGATTVIDVIFSVVSTAVGPPPSVLVNGSQAAATFNVVHSTPLSFGVSSNVTPDGPVTLFSGGLPAGATMTPSLPTSSNTGNVSSSFSWTPAPGQVGSYIVTFAGMSGTGRQTLRNVNINVTNNAPTIECPAGLNGSSIEATSAAGVLFPFAANLADADDDLLQYQLFIDGVQRQAVGGINPPSTQSFSAQLGLGAHTYLARVNDTISPAVTCSGTFTVVDTTPPTLFLPNNIVVDGSGPLGAEVLFEVTATDTVDASPTIECEHNPGFFSYGSTTVACIARDDYDNVTSGMFSVTVNDPSGPLVTYTITGTAGDNDWYTSDVGVTWSTTDPDSGVELTDGCDPQSVTADTGGVTFTCTATNSTGVSTTVTTTLIKRDATAPTISHVATSITEEATSSAGAIVTYVDPTVDDNLSGVAGTTCSQNSGTTFAIGTTAVSCTARDNAGNTASASLSITVQDTTAPSIAALLGATFEATGAAGAAISYATPAATDLVDSSVSVVCVPPSGSIAPLGATTVTCTATDDFDNSSSTTAVFSVVDTTAPDISDLLDISQPGTNPAGEAVSWIVSAADAVSGDVPVTCDPASGSTFGYSVTTVTCTATDAAGNVATDSFTVEITDATPPVITVAINGPLGLLGWYRGDVTFDWTVTDAQSPITSTSGCDDNTVTNDGVFSFTCTATSAGGTSSETRNVSIDATAPVLTLPGNFTVPATTTAGATVNYAASANDATSQLASFSCTPVSGSLFAIGNTTVQCQAADNAGNTSAGQFVIAVSDTIPPVIDDVTPSEATLWPPNHQMVAVTISVDATDNLGPAPMCTVTSVTSNEPQNGLGDGDTPNDWLLTGGLGVQLRAERAGRGDGRVYTINVRCVDASGNATISSTTVSVPKSQGR